MTRELIKFSSCPLAWTESSPPFFLEGTIISSSAPFSSLLVGPLDNYLPSILFFHSHLPIDLFFLLYLLAIRCAIRDISMKRSHDSWSLEVRCLCLSFCSLPPKSVLPSFVCEEDTQTKSRIRANHTHWKHSRGNKRIFNSSMIFGLWKPNAISLPLWVRTWHVWVSSWTHRTHDKQWTWSSFFFVHECARILSR